MSLSYALGYTRQLRPESGGGGGGGGGGSNNAPVIDLNGADAGINNTGTFTEGDSYTSYLSAATLTDPDGDPIGSLVMTCGGSWGADGPDELIKFDTWTTDSDTDKTENLVVGGTTFRLAFVAATGVLTVTNSADEFFSAADGQSLIRLFQYANSAEPPTEGDRTFTWVASDTVALKDVGADYYVDPLRGDDINGDGSLASPFRSYWRATGSVSPGESVGLLPVAVDVDPVHPIQDDSDISWNVIAASSNSRATFNGARIILGNSKTPFVRTNFGLMDMFSAIDSNTNQLPVGWRSTLQFPTDGSGNGGHVTGADDDGDGVTDCCEISANGVGAARASIELVSANRAATGHMFSVSADLKSDGNANNFDIGLVFGVRLNGSGSWYYYNGSSWVTTTPGTGTTGNAIKLSTDSSASTFSTSVTDWTTFTWDIEIPQDNFAYTGGSFGQFEIFIAFVSRSSAAGAAYIKNITIPSPDWVEGAANEWYLPTREGGTTDQRIRKSDNSVLKYNSSAPTDGTTFRQSLGLTTIYSATDPNTIDDTWKLYTRTVGAFVPQGDVALTRIRLTGFLYGVLPAITTANTITLTDCRMDDIASYGFRQTAASTLIVDIEDCEFEKCGDYQAYAQWGDYATGDGAAIKTTGPTTCLRNDFRQNYLDIYVAGTNSGGSIIRYNTSYDCEVNSIWVAGANFNGDCYIEHNTIVNQTIHGIICRDQVGGIGTNYVRSNIIVTNDPEGVATGLQFDANSQTVVSDNNLCYGNDANWVWNGIYYTALAAYQTASSQDANSYDTDPLLVNPSGGNFTPGSGSDALSNGHDGQNIGAV